MQKLHSGLACTLPINYSLREIPVWKLTPGMALNQRLHFNFVMQPTAGLRRALWCQCPNGRSSLEGSDWLPPTGICTAFAYRLQGNV